MYRLEIIAALFATPAVADPDGYGHMSGWGYGMGMMSGPIHWIIALGLVVASIVWFISNMDGGRQRLESPMR